jgi:hypothetical protein
MTRKTGSVVERPAAVELLASPARQEIVDALGALGGEATAVDVADQLGRPVDGLYYHLRLLVAGGVVEELPDQGTGRRYRVPTGLRLRYRPGKTRNARAVGRFAAGMLRVARRDFEAALGDPGVVVEGKKRVLWAARTKGWVGEEELAEVNQLLARLDEIIHPERSARRDRLVSLTWVLAPVPAKPSRRT